MNDEYAEMGMRGEALVMRYLEQHGYHVERVEMDVQKKTTVHGQRVTDPTGATIPLVDLRCCTSIGYGAAAVVEVKTKTEPGWKYSPRPGRWEHGVDLNLWEEGYKMQREGNLWLCFVELWTPKVREDGTVALGPHGREMRKDERSTFMDERGFHEPLLSWCDTRVHRGRVQERWMYDFDGWVPGRLFLRCDMKQTELHEPPPFHPVVR